MLTLPSRRHGKAARISGEAEDWGRRMAGKLIAKVMDGLLGVGGGAAIVLCDEQGNLLPCQMCSTLETGIDQIGKLTVTFLIDGRDIMLEPNATWEDPMARPWGKSIQE